MTILGCYSTERLTSREQPKCPWGSPDIDPTDPGIPENKGLFHRHNLPYPRGVVHVGLWKFEEAEDYRFLIGSNLIGFEANPYIYETYSKHTCDLYGFDSFCIALGDKDYEEPFTLRAPADRLDTGGFYTDGDMEWQVRKTSLDHWFEHSEFDPLDYNFLNIDTEGSELDILKGASQFLQTVDYLLVEVSVNNRFRTGYGLQEIAYQLDQFEIADCESELFSRGWGDVFFVRKTI